MGRRDTQKGGGYLAKVSHLYFDNKISSCCA
jgi:hypothetical protein